MQSGKRLTLKDYFAKLNILVHTIIIKIQMFSGIVIVNCQIQLFLDNMVLANQNAKLVSPDQGFLVPPFVLIRKPWERGWILVNHLMELTIKSS